MKTNTFLNNKNQLIVRIGLFLGVLAITSGCYTQDVNTFSSSDSLLKTAVVIPNPPEDYQNLLNPLQVDEVNLTKGKLYYQSNCAACHGERGQGDGPVSASLNPKPANLAANINSLSDGYIFWRISEGGLVVPFTSVMPAWKSLLDPDKIWQIVIYLKSFELKP